MFMQRFAGHRKGLRISIIVGAMLLLSIVVVFAQGPLPRTPRSPQAALSTGFTYQGQLKNGNAAVNGQCDLAFRLYDDVSAGNQIGLAITQTVPITNGLFMVVLNDAGQFGVGAFSGDARWLEIKVSTTCPASGSFTTLSPRQALTAVPYAFFSAAPWVTSGSNLSYSGGNVGIGTTSPGSKLTVAGTIESTSGGVKFPDGTLQTTAATKYQNVKVIAKSGGDYTTISAALTSIADNSATNHYLIYVAPGTYTETVTMKPYVDIEDAGELTTKITYTGSPMGGNGTVFGANNGELRFLTVKTPAGVRWLMLSTTSPHRRA